MSKLEKEISEALGEKGKQGEKESREKYLARLVRDANELPDEKFEKLSNKAQDWLNAGVDAIRAKKPVDDFDGAKTEKSEKPAKGEKKGSKEKSEKPAKEKPAKKEKTEKPVKEKKAKSGDRGKTLLFRKLQAQHPKWGVKELMEAMEKKGHAVAIGTAKQTYQGTRQTLDALRELGMLPKEKEEA